MILNENYYRSIWDKLEEVKTLLPTFETNFIRLSLKIILSHYQKGQPIHINFQETNDVINEIGRNLFIELANDIYLNHYDLPNSFSVGDKLKRIKDNQYYEIIRARNNSYDLRQIMRKSNKGALLTLIPEINYDKLAVGFVKVDSGVSERTIKNYFDFFEKINNQPKEFPRTKFEQKSVFIAKKPLWEYLVDKNKIPSVYLPNPREESSLSEIRSIPALSDCLIYVTPKYDTCYQKLLVKDEKIKTIVVFDTEANKITQMLQDKFRFGFNLIVLSNSQTPIRNNSIPCWNWYREEMEIINKL